MKPQRFPQAELTAGDLGRILRVIEECEHATSLRDFRERTLEAMARHLGYRNATFFLGASVELLFRDKRAVGIGRPAGIIPEYAERFQPDDVFCQAHAVTLLGNRRVATLDQLGAPRRRNNRDYLDNFLFRHGLYAKLVMALPASRSLVGGIGLLDPTPGAFGPRSVAVATLLGRHLTNLLRRHGATEDVTAPTGVPGLSPRQIEVVELVARGHTNAEIAHVLRIGVDTVKKHVTGILAVTGHRNRTQLALAWRAAGRTPES